MSDVMSRVAAAPISWGVCEAPGWGYQMGHERVLKEMAELQIAATEFGPVGFLPSGPQAKAAELAKYGLGAVGGFVPLPLHDATFDPTSTVDHALEGFVAAGADTLVLAADTDGEGYDARVELDEGQWRTLFANLDRLAARSAERGIRATLHPHVGTVIERKDDVDRLLDGSSVPLCLDTGHLMVGGVSPEELTERATGRIDHVHLKDVDAGLAERVRAGELEYSAAVRQGLFRPLGDGDVDLARIITTLEGAGYRGWYVLEQDVMLDAEPADGEGPIDDVRRSLDYLRGLTR